MLKYLVYLFIFSVSIDVYTYSTPLVHVRHVEAVLYPVCGSGSGSVSDMRKRPHVQSAEAAPCPVCRSGSVSSLQKRKRLHVRHAEVAPGLHYINIKFLIDDMLKYLVYLCIFSVSINV